MSFGITELLVFVFFGIVTGAIAKSKGRNMILWGIVGFMIPVIGLIVVALLPRDASGVEQQALSDGKLKRCPKCAEAIQAEAVKCRFCGEDLT